MDYPKFSVSKQKEESISIQRVKHIVLKSVTNTYRQYLDYVAYVYI